VRTTGKYNTNLVNKLTQNIQSKAASECIHVSLGKEESELRADVLGVIRNKHLHERVIQIMRNNVNSEKNTPRMMCHRSAGVCLARLLSAWSTHQR